MASTTHKFNFSHFQKFLCPLHYDDVTLLQMNFTNLINYSAMMRIKHSVLSNWLCNNWNENISGSLCFLYTTYHTYVWKLNTVIPNWINESPFDNKKYYLWNNRTNRFIYGNNNMAVSFLVFHMLIKNYSNYLITTPLMEYFVADVVTFILKIFTLAWIQFALICIIDF